MNGIVPVSFDWTVGHGLLIEQAGKEIVLDDDQVLTLLAFYWDLGDKDEVIEIVRQVASRLGLLEDLQ
jgi:hypothetical protein